MTGIFCQKGNEKSGLTPLQRRHLCRWRVSQCSAPPLLIDNVGVDSSIARSQLGAEEPQSS